MARTKKRVEPSAKESPSSPDGKAVFQVRLDADVHEKLKDSAAAAGISMNQLIQGILRWAADNVRQGRPINVGGELVEEKASECVWFGQPSDDFEIGKSTRFHFLLDYSGRRAVGSELPRVDGED